MSFPAIPSNVDQYVREILNKMLGRIGNVGDKVVTYNDLAESGLLIASPQALTKPSNPNQSINDSLTKPDTGSTGGTVSPGTPVVEPPTTPVGLKTAGIFGAIVLEWTPPTYQGHSYSEIYRAQVDDVTQSQVTHVASTFSYTDIVETQSIYYYWIRHVNSNGQRSALNQVAGTPGQASAEPSIILDVVQGEIDKSYFTPEWAAHTNAEEAKLAQAQIDITSQGQRIGNNESSISNLDQTTADQAQSIVQLETTDGVHTGKITTLEQTTSNQATQINQLSTTTGENTAAITEQKAVTDGLKAEYTLKVTQDSSTNQPIVAAIGVASGQEEDGTPFSEIAMVAENFYFNTPDGTRNPFSIINVGTDSSTDYKISMNADVLINGAVSINQLESGELKPGTQLSIGRGSFEMSTATDGTGQLIISGDGGIANNDYIIINAGRIQTHVYTDTKGHVPYKEVKRMEVGTASSGQQVKIPAYFKSQPFIHLYPRDMSVYNHEKASFSQKIEMFNSAPVPDPNDEGAWLFTPYVRLVIAAGSEVVSPAWSYAGSSNSQEWITTGITEMEAVHVATRCASYRRTTGTTYQNRQVTVYLDYRLTGTSAWSTGDTETVNINLFEILIVQLTKTLPQNTYDIRIRFVAADRSGTFTDGNPTYNYTDRAATGNPHNKVYSYLGNSDQYNKKVPLSINMPSMSGWEILRIQYKCIADMTIKVRYRYYWGAQPNKRLGKIRVRLPKGNDEIETIEHQALTSDWNWKTYQYNDKTFEFEDTSYKNGQIKPDIDLFYSGGGYTYYGIGSYPFEITSELTLNIKSVTATVYYRQQVSNPATYNNFYLDSLRYDKSETDISLDTAVVTWMAISNS